MNHLDSLTTWEKIMNMAKLGIVSAAGNYFHSFGKWLKQRAGGLMHYTLCVFQDKARRNGSRYGFAFDIPAISGRALFAPGELARKSGSYVIPGQSAMGWKLIANPRQYRPTAERLFAQNPVTVPPSKTAKPRKPLPALAYRRFPQNLETVPSSGVLPVCPVCFRRLS